MSVFSYIKMKGSNIRAITGTSGEIPGKYKEIGLWGSELKNINISIYNKPRNFYKTIKNVDKRIKIVL